MDYATKDFIGFLLLATAIGAVFHVDPATVMQVIGTIVAPQTQQTK